MKRYKFTDENAFSESIEAASMQEAIEYADEWCRQGDWDPSGQRVRVEVTEHDESGNQTDIQYVEVEIEPDHQAMIAEAVKDVDECELCDEFEFHEWEVEESGEKDVDGLVTFRCRDCELRRVERSDGEVIMYQYG